MCVYVGSAYPYMLTAPRFRLINMVLETPPEMPPHQRIGKALGEVGHLSLAVAFQNLALIYLCSRLVAPWVADFCVFAAVTLVFDFVYHLTFFVAVLSVDVQRMELSDSLKWVESTQGPKKKHKGRQSWLAALREGTLPLSTRFAGTVAIFSVILAINWHFFDSTEKDLSFNNLRRKLMSSKQKRNSDTTWSSPPINQARTPADWLRIQDHNTARELFGFIKPGAHSFIARIYDPLLVVSKGAHGRDRPQSPTSWLDYLRRYARGHAFPVALTVVFLIAGVTLLMNYLLWTGSPETLDGDKDDEVVLSVKTLPTPQSLDIDSMVSCSKGHLASISLDKSTSIWLHDRRGYIHRILQTATMKPKLWPVLASAMDDGGSLLALCADTGHIGLWSIAALRFLIFPTIELGGRPPALFSFVAITREDCEKLYLVVVNPDGFLTEIDARTGLHQTKRICRSPIISATLYTCTRDDASLIFVTKPGEVHILSLREWSNSTSEIVAGLDPGPPPGSNPAKIKSIQGVPSLGLIFALRDEEAEMFDFTSRALIHSFQIGHVKPHSFRVMHSNRRLCPCGAPAVHSLSVVYAEQETEHMIMQTFILDDNASSQICLGKPPDRGKYKCQGLDCAIERVHYVEPAGVWESTSALSVVGIRRCVHSSTPSSIISAGDDDDSAADSSALASAVKERAHKQSTSNSSFRSLNSRGSRHSDSPGDTDSWEAWTLSWTGEFRSRPLFPDNLEDAESSFDDDELFVAAPGPITRLGKRSVAVAFGNMVKIITLGSESFDGLMVGEDGADVGLGNYKWRTNKSGGRKVQ